MRTPTRLSRHLGSYLTSLPTRLQSSVLPMIDAIWEGERLSVTGIGRVLLGRAKVKYKIKQVSRLIGNPTLHTRFNDLFAAIAAMLITSPRPVLLVDWTDHDVHNYALVVSIPHDGRSIPIYVEVHPIADYAKAHVESAFLHTLKEKILPKGCRPILVSDAGFRLPWFRQVTALGWNYVGRLLGNICLQSQEARSEVWLHRSVFDTYRWTRPTELGTFLCAKGERMPARLVGVFYREQRHPSQARGKSKTGRHGTKYRKQADKPWLLVTNIDAKDIDAAGIVQLYALRMEIEEMFRDDKNRDTGVGLDASDSRDPNRLRALRWLGALNTILTHIVGRIGESLGVDRNYHTSTTTERRILSLPMLGRLMLRHEDRRIFSDKRIQSAINGIREKNDINHIIKHSKIAA